MARTTLADVQGIIAVDASLIPTETAALGFITPANELVTEACTGTAGPSTAYTAARLELIERHLAAHFYTLQDPRAVTEKADDVSATYQSKVDLGFATSHYGQTAMRLDTNGGLAKLNRKMLKGPQTVGGFWAGTDPDAATSTTSTTTITTTAGDDVTLTETTEDITLPILDDDGVHIGRHVVAASGAEEKTITVPNPVLYNSKDKRRSVIVIENTDGLADVTIAAGGAGSGTFVTAQNPEGVDTLTLSHAATSYTMRSNGDKWIIFTEVS